MLYEESNCGLSEMKQNQLLKHTTLARGIAFSRYHFFNRESRKFMVNEHHKIVSNTLQRVLDGEIKRLIINMPPGYTKTEEAVINFMARGLAINAQSLFMHLSYSNDLAIENSIKCRDIYVSDEYQALHPVPLRKDVKAKKKWYNVNGGGVYATAAGGPVTGFRAGRMIKDKFTGAMIIDDPIKPDEAYSAAVRTKINNRFTNTFKSRLALESETPIILMMQRIHEEDPCGFLLGGGTGEKWHHLLLPVDIPEKPILDWYPYKKYTHGIPIEYELKPGPLWRIKHNEEQIKQMELADPYTFASQYMQTPAPAGGAIFKEHYWTGQFYETLPLDITHMTIYGDTAEEVNNWNDYSVFQCWAHSPTMGIFLIDQIRGKWESPELLTVAKAFYRKWNKRDLSKRYRLREMKIEKKSSGTSLIKTLALERDIIVVPIERTRDKVSRAFGCVPHICVKKVFLPAEATFINDLLKELREFTPLMTHKHDDQIDPMLDAIEDLLIEPTTLYNGAI